MLFLGGRPGFLFGAGLDSGIGSGSVGMGYGFRDDVRDAKFFMDWSEDMCG